MKILGGDAAELLGGSRHQLILDVIACFSIMQLKLV